MRKVIERLLVENSSQSRLDVVWIVGGCKQTDLGMDWR